ncbi:MULTISPECIES: hypothetical protein [Burkholderia]|uniref:Phospholipid methyltransferase n=1 Tax=Burkholderia aenigmatica TaxID=2015348 RepID=A0A228INC4_9BURK|nr:MULTISPECIES: hypothetical protein [Burkholderia]MBN3843269.1 hypothetical protein [Burkholderia sp. Ac-20349]OXI43755.1 hypothetical protein CFB84_19605 [Burkholderia aenigmatica]
MTNTLAFWKGFIANPRRVSAIAPSGSALAELITREVAVHHAPVIELGPGTGVFTHRLIERGIPENRLALIESGSEFADQLAGRFPRATVLNVDAGRLGRIELFGGVAAGAVVSGLPLLSMPVKSVLRILFGAFAHLHPRGAFYQFTYGPHCPVPRLVLERLGLRASRIGWVFWNLPPASVYRITRRAHSFDIRTRHLKP